MKKRPIKRAVFICKMPELGWCTMHLNGRLQWTGAVVGMATKEEAIKNAAESRRITRKQGHIVARGLSA